MKRLIVAGVVAFVASACAPVTYTKADLDGKVVCNPDYMDQVERQARRNFVTVLWVNCPRATLRVVT